MKSEGKDRRKHPRMPVSVQVRYRNLDDFFYDYALNISHGGIFIKTRRPLEKGAEVEIEFEVPDTQSKFKTRGRVVRVIFSGDDEYEPAGMGVAFDPLEESDKKMIDLLWQTTSETGKSEINP